MAKPVDLPTDWSSTASYPAEVYPATYPAGHPLAGEPHPLAGNAVPWSGQPTTDTDVEATLAAIGLHPGKPIPAPGFNSWIKRARAWLLWLSGGTSVADETAHVVETDSAGRAGVFELYCENEIEAAGAVNFTNDVGGDFTCDIPAIFNTSVTLGNAAGDVITVTGTATCTEPVTMPETRLSDSGSTLPGAAGRIRSNGTFYSVGTSLGVHTIDEPRRALSTGHTTGSSAASTGTSATRRIKHNEPVWGEITATYTNSIANTAINLDVTVAYGGGSATIHVRTFQADTAAKRYSLHTIFRWTPTDSFGGVATPESYTFTVRMGTPSGNMTGDDVSLKVSCALQV